MTNAPPMVSSPARLRPSRGRKPVRSVCGMFQTVAIACCTVWVTPWAP